MCAAAGAAGGQAGCGMLPLLGVPPGSAAGGAAVPLNTPTQTARLRLVLGQLRPMPERQKVNLDRGTGLVRASATMSAVGM